MPSVGEKAWTGFGNTAGRPSSPLRVGYFGALSLTGIVLCQQSTWWHCLLALWLLTFGETPGRSNRRLGLGETVAKADFLFVRINSSMSAIGTKRTCTGAPRMSAFGSKPDIGNYLPITPNTPSTRARMVTESRLVSATEARFEDSHITSQAIPAAITPKSKPEYPNQ